ncbi:TPA: acyl-CoA thioesterase [Legionella pneumophila]|uniref:acyl-CoA thioesterase n=1 Tax=Legionella TaxID=445 RepID=UPI0007783185|nr:MULTISPECIES: thioesterase family protein [Legionella]HAT8859122.1 acyl-CoA thioesterase [Legionella pneumophila subsp. pneumophila]MCW8396521.1 acyl-CoA thioesterase [Legionella sp. PATHC039]HAT8580427.1 acyl-CoA thioesterase [Legionella pneumophila]HAT8641286.1 acyl-CoA thioesterase [Legionella pneumophila]HAT9650482.1 acyl-CoA thioesterase [Legionella pneumophila subsp. pneumophila]
MTEINEIIHKKTFDIAWGDMDALGHVNNARYFDYFQEARIDWLRELDIKMTGQTGPVVIHVACTFLKPIVYPATVTIHSKVHSLGNSSMIMDHDLYQEETLMAQGVSKIVWIDYTQNKSVPLPDIIRNLV